jgi:hypothetical protein
MANIGVGETYRAVLVKKDFANLVDAYIKENAPTEEILSLEYCKSFKYRFLSKEEMTRQAMSGWLKNSNAVTLFTSDTVLKPIARDKIYFLDGVMKGKYLQIVSAKPLVESGSFYFSKKPPHIMELE